MVVDPQKLECKAAEASKLLKAMCNPHRLELLCQLLKGERSVGDLTFHTRLGQSAVSQHLAVLRRQGLVKTRRERQVVFYSLQGHEAITILETLYRLYCGEGGVKISEAA